MPFFGSGREALQEMLGKPNKSSYSLFLITEHKWFKLIKQLGIHSNGSTCWWAEVACLHNVCESDFKRVTGHGITYTSKLWWQISAFIYRWKDGEREQQQPHPPSCLLNVNKLCVGVLPHNLILVKISWIWNNQCGKNKHFLGALQQCVISVLYSWSFFSAPHLLSEAECARSLSLYNPV